MAAPCRRRDHARERLLSVTSPLSQPALEPRQHLGRRCRDLRLHKIVGAGGADVDDGDRHVELARAAHEPESRVDGQRRADHQERLAAIEQLPNGGQRKLGNVAAEENCVRLHVAAARAAPDHLEAGDRVGRQMGVAVGTDVRGGLEPAGVRLQQALLHAVPTFGAAAPETEDLGQSAVELDDLATAGTLVWAIDVLRDHAGQQAGRLQGGPRALDRGRSAERNRAQPTVARAQ
jgi:hypothetical protein